MLRPAQHGEQQNDEESDWRNGTPLFLRHTGMSTDSKRATAANGILVLEHCWCQLRVLVLVLCPKRSNANRILLSEHGSHMNQFFIFLFWCVAQSRLLMKKVKTPNDKIVAVDAEVQKESWLHSPLIEGNQRHLQHVFAAMIQLHPSLYGACHKVEAGRICCGSMQTATAGSYLNSAK